MSKIKLIGIQSVILLFILCLIPNIWYLNIFLNGDEKVISKTYAVGLQETTDGDIDYFMEINLYDNLFEVKFNYLMDETQSSLYSQGIQIFGDIEFEQTTGNFQLEDKHQVGGSTLWKDFEYNQYKTYDLTSGDYYNYQSYDNYETTTNSTNPIDDDTYFKIQLGNDTEKEIFLMKFKGDNTPLNSDTYLGYDTWKDGLFGRTDHLVNYYIHYDINYLLNILYNSVQSLPAGTNQSVVFEFGDLFDYYEYDESSSTYIGEPVSLDKASLIINDTKSYYAIKVFVNEGDALKSSDSIFNCIAGNSNYNATGDYDSEDYFIGKTMIVCTYSYFDFVQISENNYAFKLKQSFIDYLNLPQNKNKIVLKIEINLDDLNNLGYTFVGFTEDNGLSDFEILECYTLETIDNELVKTVVDYE